MRVTIKGLTASTITFNTLGIVLRGAISARNIDIKNDEQLREINSIRNAKLISVETEGEYQSPPEETKPIIQSIREREEALKETEKEVQTQPEQQEETEVDIQAEQSDTIEDSPAPKRGRGRPKNAKNKNKVKEAIKAEKEASKEISNAIKPKPIKKLDSSENTVSVNDESESEVTIMTPGGAVKGKARRSFTRDMPESEATQASIEALRQMDLEENESQEQTPIDETKLDPSERMGEKAVISTGRNGTLAIGMKNSILPEAKQVSDAVIFIDAKDDAFTKKEEDRSKSAFIEGLDDIEDPNDLIES